MLEAELAALASDDFLLDLGRNRYVMSRTENLAPLLDLPPATVELERAGGELVLRHTAVPAALGIVLEDARPYESPGWILFSDNAIDLLPGKTRTLRVEGEGPLLVESWNLEAQRVA